MALPRLEGIQINQEKFFEAHRWIRRELDNSISFWLEHGMDPVFGGVYTCLDRTGNLYSTDKSVWMQGRCAWSFAWLCHLYGPKPQWLDASKSCLEFLEKHCVNQESGGRLFFTVTGDGRPLRQRRYCFSEAFAAMANAEYYGVTGDPLCLTRARKYFELVYQLNNGALQDPTGLGPKIIPQSRAVKSLADSMIFLNLCCVFRRCDPERKALYDQRAAACADAIARFHVKLQLGCTLETVGQDGKPQLEHSAGRLVNPGHDMECSWFLLEQAAETQDNALMELAIQIFDNAFSQGWDKEYGGILYALDCLGHPPELYEHDMKLWWPHNEAMIASMMIYRHTKQPDYLEKFYQVLDYCQVHFADPSYGEWFGYLRRDGAPTQPPCKGSTFKGPFHLLRCLSMVDKLMEQLSQSPDF